MVHEQRAFIYSLCVAFLFHVILFALFIGMTIEHYQGLVALVNNGQIYNQTNVPPKTNKNTISNGLYCSGHESVELILDTQLIAILKQIGIRPVATADIDNKKPMKQFVIPKSSSKIIKEKQNKKIIKTEEKKQKTAPLKKEAIQKAKEYPVTTIVLPVEEPVQKTSKIVSDDIQKNEKKAVVSQQINAVTSVSINKNKVEAQNIPANGTTIAEKSVVQSTDENNIMSTIQIGISGNAHNAHPWELEAEAKLSFSVHEAIRQYWNPPPGWADGGAVKIYVIISPDKKIQTNYQTHSKILAKNYEAQQAVIKGITEIVDSVRGRKFMLELP